MSKITVKVGKIEGQGVNIQRVIEGLKDLKAELEGMGCRVSIEVAGQEIGEGAGNGTRTRDILLGKKSVTGERGK